MRTRLSGYKGVVPYLRSTETVHCRKTFAIGRSLTGTYSNLCEEHMSSRITIAHRADSRGAYLTVTEYESMVLLRNISESEYAKIMNSQRSHDAVTVLAGGQLGSRSAVKLSSCQIVSEWQVKEHLQAERIAVWRFLSSIFIRGHTQQNTTYTIGPDLIDVGFYHML